MVGEEEALTAFPPGGPPPGGWATAAELQAALVPLEALYTQLLEAVQVEYWVGPLLDALCAQLL